MSDIDIKNPIQAEYRVEHLFLLIGSNPLPNYIAAQLLWEREIEGAKIYLVCSEETQTIAEILASKLKLENYKKQFILVSASDPLDIYQKVNQCACDVNGRLGLNYTGGTKAMAVHAHQSVVDLERQCVFSYLDASTLKMVIEGNGTPTVRIPVGNALQISMQDMLELHGYHYHRSKKRGLVEPDAEPMQPDFLELWARVEFEARDTWVNEKLLYFSQKEKRDLVRPYDELRFVSLPRENKFTVLANYWDKHKLKTFEDFACAWNMTGDKDKKSKLGSWLYSFWLEDYVLMCIQMVAKQCGIHETGKSVELYDPLVNGYEPEGGHFEFDVYAIKGIQLFGISCTIERKKLLKLKLFEAFVRARQIGGDEARVSLVCMANENPISGRPNLKRQLKESWDESSNMIEIFGEQDLQIDPDGTHELQQRLIKWFKGEIVHG